jgi:hypothetical protein
MIIEAPKLFGLKFKSSGQQLAGFALKCIKIKSNMIDTVY